MPITAESIHANASRVLATPQKMPMLSIVFRRLNSRQREMISLLRRTSIFATLTESELVEILHLLYERVYATGEVIFSESEPGLGLYVVFKGEVEIGRLGQDNKGQLAQLGPGEVFGEVSFLDGGSRSTTVTAGVKTELIGFYRTELMDLLQRKPVLASKILLALARQISLRMRAMLQMVQS